MGLLVRVPVPGCSRLEVHARRRANALPEPHSASSFPSPFPTREPAYSAARAQSLTKQGKPPKAGAFVCFPCRLPRRRPCSLAPLRGVRLDPVGLPRGANTTLRAAERPPAAASPRERGRFLRRRGRFSLRALLFAFLAARQRHQQTASLGPECRQPILTHSSHLWVEQQA